MKNLLPVTQEIVQLVEDRSGCPVEFLPDGSLAVQASLQMARNGVDAHVLRYRPNNRPLDYWVAYQCGFALRFFDLPPDQRFDLVSSGEGTDQVKSMMTVALSLDDGDKARLDNFASKVQHWAMLNMRSYPVGMRIDQWIYDQFSDLRPLQREGLHQVQQENLNLMTMTIGKLSIPLPLLAPVAAYALFADHLLGDTTFAVPWRGAGAISAGAELLDIWRKIPADNAHDRELIDSWATSMGIAHWFGWRQYTMQA